MRHDRLVARSGVRRKRAKGRLRVRECGLRRQLGALGTQLADREIYLELADDFESFLASLHHKTQTAPTPLAIAGCLAIRVGLGGVIGPRLCSLSAGTRPVPDAVQAFPDRTVRPHAARPSPAAGERGIAPLSVKFATFS